MEQSSLRLYDAKDEYRINCIKKFFERDHLSAVDQRIA